MPPRNPRPKRIVLKTQPESVQETAPAPVIHVPVHASGGYHRRSYYLGLTIVGILGIIGGLLIAIDKFKTDEEIIALSQDFTKKVDSYDVNKWQAYKSEEYGFEFKYPTFLEIEHSAGNEFILGMPEGGSVRAIVRNKPFDPKNITDYIGNAPEPVSVGNTIKVMVGEKVWYRYEFQDEACGGVAYQTGFGENTLLTSFSNCAGDSEPLVNTPELVEKVLSTFKFAESEGEMLIKACPEMWYENRMPSIQNKGLSPEYYIYKGVRRELFEFDTDWIKDNCDLEKQIVY